MTFRSAVVDGFRWKLEAGAIMTDDGSHIFDVSGFASTVSFDAMGDGVG